MKKLFLFIFIVSFLFPLASSAGTYKVCDKDPNNIGRCLANTEKDATYSGLVPCGKSQAGPGESQEVKAPCQFCHFFVMFKGILDFALKLVITIAVLMFVYGGFLYLVSGNNPSQLQTAMKVLTSTVIGLIIIFAAWIIISTIFVFLGLSTFGLDLTGPDKWFTISCPITI